MGKAVAAPDSMMDAEKLTRWQGSSRGATGKEKHEAFHKRRAAVTAASRFARPRNFLNVEPFLVVLVRE